MGSNEGKFPFNIKHIKGDGWILNPKLSADKLTTKKRNVTALRTAYPVRDNVGNLTIE